MNRNTNNIITSTRVNNNSNDISHNYQYINNNNNNTHSDIINSLFKIKFPIAIQENRNVKFNYKTFLTKYHDTHKYRNSVNVSVININDPDVISHGCFNKNEMNWIFYIPRITNFNQDEDIEKNEIISKFLINLRKDIETENSNDLYIVLVNMYESLPKFQDNTLNFTFYKLFSKQCILHSLNLTTAPTICYLAQKLSQPISNCKALHNLFLINDNMQKDLRFTDFIKKFNFLIRNQYYNLLLNSFNLWYRYKTDEIAYTLDMKNTAVDLINRCKLDNNPHFLYSNLGKRFFDQIYKPFQENDEKTIKLLLAIVKIQFSTTY